MDTLEEMLQSVEDEINLAKETRRKARNNRKTIQAASDNKKSLRNKMLKKTRNKRRRNKKSVEVGANS